MGRTQLPDGRRNSIAVRLSDAERDAVEAARGEVPRADWVRGLILSALGLDDAHEAERVCPGCGTRFKRKAKYCSDRCGDTARHREREAARKGAEASRPGPVKATGGSEGEGVPEVRTEPPQAVPVRARKARTAPPVAADPAPPSSKPQVPLHTVPKSAARAKALTAIGKKLGPGDRAKALRGLQQITARDVSAVTDQAPGAVVFMSYDPADGDPYTTGAVPEPAEKGRKKGLDPDVRRPVRAGRS